jgi:2-polyprenyl-3-methyl-5-hydroxy-6-metoxy-1,4-benzoquinol methylase
MVLDRWRWLRARLPVTKNGEGLIDVGCGSGAFTIGAALRGYEAVGLSWDQYNQQAAIERAAICGARRVTFPIQDVRRLDERPELRSRFDVAICLENIEHVIDDLKLMRDIYHCLKPGGMLMLSAPNYFYHSIGGDQGPFSQVEDGGHVRRGYTNAMLRELCRQTGFIVEEVHSCGGFFSQKISKLQRWVRPFMLAWAITVPMRVLPLLFDRLIANVTGYTDYSICLMAYKPRWPTE